VHVTRQPCCDFSARAARYAAARRRGVYYFQHRFCAFRPLTHSTANAHARARHFSNIRRSLCPSLPLLAPFSPPFPPSPLPVAFFAPPPLPHALWDGEPSAESIGPRYNFLDVARPFARADQFSAKSASPRAIPAT